MDEKYWVIFLISYRVYSQSYTHWNIKHGSFFSRSFWKCFWKFYWVLLEILNGPFWATICKMLAFKNTGFRYCWLSNFFNVSTFNTRTVTQTRTIKLTMPFSERSQKNLSSALKTFAQTVTNFFAATFRKYIKWAIFANLMTVLQNSGRKYDKSDTIFLIHSLNSIRPLVYFIFTFKNSKIQFHEVPPLHYALVCKIHI